MRLIDSRSFAAHQTIFVTAQAPEQPKKRKHWSSDRASFHAVCHDQLPLTIGLRL
jgi:hypothetical protein